MPTQPSVKPRTRPDDCPFPAADDADVIGPILDELEAADDVRQLALEIASTVESTMWVIGKRRSSVAAASVYVAGRLAAAGEPLFKQRDVAEASSASVGSIVNHQSDIHWIYESMSATS